LLPVTVKDDRVAENWAKN